MVTNYYDRGSASQLWPSSWFLCRTFGHWWRHYLCASLLLCLYERLSCKSRRCHGLGHWHLPYLYDPNLDYGAIAQYKRGNTNLNTIKVWAPGMLLGVLTGSLISSFYGGKWLAILFGSIMILNALNTFFRAKAKPMLDHMPNNFIQRVIAFASHSCL